MNNVGPVFETAKTKGTMYLSTNARGDLQYRLGRHTTGDRTLNKQLASACGGTGRTPDNTAQTHWHKPLGPIGGQYNLNPEPNGSRPCNLQAGGIGQVQPSHSKDPRGQGSVLKIDGPGHPSVRTEPTSPARPEKVDMETVKERGE